MYKISKLELFLEYGFIVYICLHQEAKCQGQGEDSGNLEGTRYLWREYTVSEVLRRTQEDVEGRLFSVGMDCRDNLIQPTHFADEEIKTLEC